MKSTCLRRILPLRKFMMAHNRQNKQICMLSLFGLSSQRMLFLGCSPTVGGYTTVPYRIALSAKRLRGASTTNCPVIMANLSHYIGSLLQLQVHNILVSSPHYLHVCSQPHFVRTLDVLAAATTSQFTEATSDTPVVSLQE